MGAPDANKSPRSPSLFPHPRLCEAESETGTGSEDRASQDTCAAALLPCDVAMDATTCSALCSALGVHYKPLARDLARTLMSSVLVSHSTPREHACFMTSDVSNATRRRAGSYGNKSGPCSDREFARGATSP